MHNHSHNHCEHEDLKYCKHCRVPYCKNCGYEWRNYSYWNYPYTYTLGGVQYQAQTVTKDNTGSISGDTVKLTTTACEHK